MLGVLIMVLVIWNILVRSEWLAVECGVSVVWLGDWWAVVWVVG